MILYYGLPIAVIAASTSIGANKGSLYGWLFGFVMLIAGTVLGKITGLYALNGLILLALCYGGWQLWGEK